PALTEDLEDLLCPSNGKGGDEDRNPLPDRVDRLVVQIRTGILKRGMSIPVAVCGFENQRVRTRWGLDVVEVGRPSAEIARKHDSSPADFEAEPRAPKEVACIPESVRQHIVGSDVIGDRSGVVASDRIKSCENLLDVGPLELPFASGLFG